MFAIFKKDLRIFIRDRWAVLFSVLVPIVVVTIIAEALFHADTGPKLLVPVVNEDQGPVAILDAVDEVQIEFVFSR